MNSHQCVNIVVPQAQIYSVSDAVTTCKWFSHNKTDKYMTGYLNSDDLASDASKYKHLPDGVLLTHPERSYVDISVV
jgi:hypothetical protein